MSDNRAKPNYLVPFILVTSLFFLWGLANSLNGSLIRHFQFALDLKRWQAGIVDSAFYFGYFVMALPAGVFMRKFGYKRGILAGLLLYASGAMLFYPAADVRVYGFFLLALFVIASGLAFLETAANLYVTVLGDKETAAWRINFAQSFNGISIVLGPIIGGLVIFSKTDYTPELLGTMSADAIAAARTEAALSVQAPYMMIAGLVLFVALLFWLTKLPEVSDNDDSETSKLGILGLLGQYRHLSFGVLAQFFYVGAQATLFGYFVDIKLDLAKQTHLGIVQRIYSVTDGMTAETMAAFHASFAMALFMLGRFVGTALMSRIEAAKVLMAFSLMAFGFTLLASAVGGMAAIVCLLVVFFCMSIMFPTIFALATKGLPTAERKLASSLVIMAIVGGAVLPPFFGALSGSFGMQSALILPAVCFGFIAFYGWQVRMSN